MITGRKKNKNNLLFLKRRFADFLAPFGESIRYDELQFFFAHFTEGKSPLLEAIFFFVLMIFLD